MVKVIKNYVRCDDCGSHLSYSNEDWFIDFNWNRTHRYKYIRCPKCGADIAIEECDN